MKKLKSLYTESLKDLRNHFKKDKWDLDHSLLIDQILCDLDYTQYRKFHDKIYAMGVSLVLENNQFLLRKEGKKCRSTNTNAKNAKRNSPKRKK